MNAVHDAAGTAMGLGDAAMAARWSGAGTGIGTGFGLAAALTVDDVSVPILGWGDWQWCSDAGANPFGLTAHLVFGVALEGPRRAVLALLD